MSAKSPSLRRIQADIRELAFEPSDRYYAAPLENDMFEWHFTIKGADGTDFQGGIYHGRILLPPDYPFKPPHIIFLTPTGRFETNTKVCLSFSAYHPELWQPAWGIRLILEALISFLPTPADGAVGAIDWPSTERKKLAIKSQSYSCPTCGPTKNLIPIKKSTTCQPTSTSAAATTTSKATTIFQKQIEELQRLQSLNHAKTETTTTTTTTAPVTFEPSTVDGATASIPDEQSPTVTVSDISQEKNTVETVGEQSVTVIEPVDETVLNTVGVQVPITSLTTSTSTTPISQSSNDAMTSDLVPELMNDEEENDTKNQQQQNANTLKTKENFVTTVNPTDTEGTEQQVLTNDISNSNNNNSALPVTAEVQVDERGGIPSTTGDVATVTAPPATAGAVGLTAPVAVANNVVGVHDPSTMLITKVLDPLLHVMIILLSIICYMLFRKIQSLVADLQELESSIAM